MSQVDTIVIGASAGGVEALSRLVAVLPPSLPAAILVVIHFPKNATSALPAILSRNGPMPAVHAEDGMPIEIGQIYCAPPGRHLLVKEDHMCLVNGPRENGNRPSIDPLFRTAAHARQNRVLGILLSGLLDDGTMGVSAIKRCSGVTICQDPEEAFFGDMPRHAMEAGCCDHVLTLAQIAQKIVELAGHSVPELTPKEKMSDPTEMTLKELRNLEQAGVPSRYVCPECQGTLFKLEEEGVPLYRCRVGHSYLTESLSAGKEEMLEAALWTGLRALEEHQDLLTTLRDRAKGKGFEASAKSYIVKIEGNEQRLALLRHVLGLGTSDTKI